VSISPNINILISLSFPVFAFFSTTDIRTRHFGLGAIYFSGRTLLTNTISHTFNHLSTLIFATPCLPNFEWKSILVEGDICASQRRASCEVLGYLARFGNDIFTARMASFLVCFSNCMLIPLNCDYPKQFFFLFHTHSYIASYVLSVLFSAFISDFFFSSLMVACRLDHYLVT